MHDALVAWSGPSRPASRLLPRLVEVRARRRPCAFGAGERVAGRALLDEQRLAVDEVVAVVLELAARERHQPRSAGQRAASGPVLHSWRGILLAGGAARSGTPSGARELVEPPLRRRRSRSGRRRPTSSARARRRRSPRASRARSSAGASSQRREALGELRHRVGPTSNVSHGRDLGRHRLGERARDLGQPGVAGDDRQRAAGGRLRGDHAERLGERARHRQRLGGGQHVGELLVLEPPGPVHARRASPRGGGAVGARPRRPERVEERGELGQLAPVLAAQRAARRRGRRAASAAASPSSPSRKRAEADDEQPRVGHARRARAARRRAAARRPWRRSACRRRPRSGRARGSSAPSAAAASRGRAGERGGGRGVAPRSAAPPAPSRRRSARAQRARGPRAARLRRRAARSGRRRRRAGRGASCPRSPGSSSAAHRLSAVWREPTSTPARAARGPRARRAGSAGAA